MAERTDTEDPGAPSGGRPEAPQPPLASFAHPSARLEPVWTEPAIAGGRPPRSGRRLLRELTIPQATATLATAFLISAMLGAVRQSLFNAEFGAGSEASAYYAAFRLPDTLFGLVAGGALSAAMIPVLLATASKDGRAAAHRLTRIVLTTLLAAFAVLIVIGFTLAQPFVSLILAPGFDRPETDLTVRLTRIMLIQPLVLAVGSVALAVLNSRSRFFLTALSTVSHNVTLILGVLATRLYPELGIYGPTLGVVAGAVLQVAIVFPGLLDGGWRQLRPAWAPRDVRLREVVHLLIPNGLSVGVGYTGFIIDTAFASRARESEALAAILNASLLIGLPVTLLGVALGQAVFPRLAQQAADGDWPKVRRTVLRALAFGMLLAIPAAAALAIGGGRAIEILFEHGKFTAEAGALTARILFVYALALPFYIATEILTRALIAQRDTRTPLFTNLAQLAGRATLIALLLDSQGARAIPIAFAATSAAESLILATVLFTRLRGKVAETPGSPSETLA